MNSNSIPVSTGRDASASLGVVTAARYHTFPSHSTGGNLEYLQSLTFTEEIEALQTAALSLGAVAVTDIAFAVNNLPGGVFVIATGTAVKG